MKKEMEIWRFAAEKLQTNGSVMLLVVAESTGSSPGRQGFKMIVAGDEMRGSIGGGVMEVALVELAKGKSKKVKGKIKSAIIEQIHRKNTPNSSGMICSGKQTVILFQLNSEHLNTVREIVLALEKHQSRVFQISNFKFQIVENQNGPDFNFQKKSRRAEAAFERQVPYEPERGGQRQPLIDVDAGFIYEEKLGIKNKLFIIGGGHCALALSEIMAKMDFHISLFDDRTDLNSLAKNKFVQEKKIIQSYEKIGEFIESGTNVYVVVMTLGYKFDEAVIRQLYDKNFKYLGVLGSRSKMKTLLKNLEKEGFDRKTLGQIHTPIGLPIKSRTPEEIAVSIAAEIIAVKNS